MYEHEFGASMQQTGNANLTLDHFQIELYSSMQYYEIYVYLIFTSVIYKFRYYYRFKIISTKLGTKHLLVIEI